MKPIILRTRTSTDECIGTVRLTPEAEKVVRRLRFKTGLPIRQINLTDGQAGLETEPPDHFLRLRGEPDGADALIGAGPGPQNNGFHGVPPLNVVKSGGAGMYLSGSAFPSAQVPAAS